MENLTIEHMIITPDIAEEMLRMNIGNRKPKRNRIFEYAYQMNNGEFKVSTDCIGFDANGILINGQNRLMACVKSGCSFEAIVARGFEHKVFEVIDQGCMRSGIDVAKDCDTYIRNSTSLAVIKFMFTVVLCDRAHNEFGNITKVHYAQKYDGISHIAYDIKNMGGSLSTSAPTTAALIAAMANGVDDESIEAFIAVGRNDIRSSSKYNNKAALDFIDLRAKISNFGSSAQKNIYEEAKRAIYLFTNNVKKTMKRDFFPLTIDQIEAINEKYSSKGVFDNE